MQVVALDMVLSVFMLQRWVLISILFVWGRPAGQISRKQQVSSSSCAAREKRNGNRRRELLLRRMSTKIMDLCLFFWKKKMNLPFSSYTHYRRNEEHLLFTVHLLTSLAWHLFWYKHVMTQFCHWISPVFSSEKLPKLTKWFCASVVWKLTQTTWKEQLPLSSWITELQCCHKSQQSINFQPLGILHFSTTNEFTSWCVFIYL